MLIHARYRCSFAEWLSVVYPTLLLSLQHSRSFVCCYGRGHVARHICIHFLSVYSFVFQFLLLPSQYTWSFSCCFGCGLVARQIYIHFWNVYSIALIPVVIFVKYTTVLLLLWAWSWLLGIFAYIFWMFTQLPTWWCCYLTKIYCHLVVAKGVVMVARANFVKLFWRKSAE